MKTNRYLALLMVPLLLAALPRTASAQRLIPNTTLSSAVTTASQQTISLTSTASAAVNALIWVDAELMQINAIPAAGVATVTRGYQGTAARTHASGRQVFLPASRTDIQITDPDYNGTCTPGLGQAVVSPWINIRNGNVSVCRVATSTWNVTNVVNITFNSTQTGTP